MPLMQLTSVFWIACASARVNKDRAVRERLSVEIGKGAYDGEYEGSVERQCTT